MRFGQWFFLGLYAPLSVYALSLGEPDVRSALNQPLHIEIPIEDRTSESAGDILVSLADPSVYQEFGLTKDYRLKDVRFSVTEVGNRVVIMASSSQPMQLADLDLMLNVRWPGGQLFRSYTILLDPIEAQLPPKVSVPVKKLSSMPKRAPVVSHRYGPVAPGETLWGISQQLATHRGLHALQWLYALSQENRSAFGHNVNALKSGAVLKIPSVSVVSGYSLQTAREWLMDQNRQWRDHSSSRPVPHAVVESHTPINPSASGPKSEVQLPGVHTLPSARLVPTAKNQVHLVEIESIPVHQSNNALEVVALQKRISQLEEKLVQKDKLIAELETQAEQDSPVIEQEANSPTAEPVAEPVVEIPASSLLVANWVWWTIGSGLTLLVLGIGWWKYRRAREAALDEETLADPSVDEEKDDEVTEEAAEETVAESVKLDPLQEADSLLQERQFDSAEQVILTSIAASPTRGDLVVMLLEIYEASGNRSAFQLWSRKVQEYELSLQWKNRLSALTGKLSEMPDVSEIVQEIETEPEPPVVSSDPTGHVMEFEVGLGDGLSVKTHQVESVEALDSAITSDEDALENTETLSESQEEGDDSPPLQSQLDLAIAYQEIGDIEGAREVLSRLVASGSGEVAAKAKALLDELS